jgi:hypothetical protein
MLASVRGTAGRQGHREAQADGMTRRRIRVLADDQHPDVLQRLLERPQHPLASGQAAASRGGLGGQEGSHRVDVCANRFQRLSPLWIDVIETQHAYDHRPGAALDFTGSSGRVEA